MWERAQQHRYPNDTLQAPALGPQVNQGCENEAQLLDKKPKKPVYAENEWQSCCNALNTK